MNYLWNIKHNQITYTKKINFLSNNKTVYVLSNTIQLSQWTPRIMQRKQNNCTIWNVTKDDTIKHGPDDTPHYYKKKKKTTPLEKNLHNKADMDNNGKSPFRVIHMYPYITFYRLPIILINNLFLYLPKYLIFRCKKMSSLPRTTHKKRQWLHEIEAKTLDTALSCPSCKYVYM